MDLIHEPAYLIVVNLSTVFGNYIQGQVSKLEKLFLQSQALEKRGLKRSKYQSYNVVT